jgi:biopolymer transport protein ExbB
LEAAPDSHRALEVCRANGSPVARVLAEAVRRRHEPRELMERHVEEAGAREIVPLRQRMRVLSALPQVATMLGLLGTVFGMIKTFQQVAATSEALGKTESLAEGIFEAWTCTAGGLFVAIPVLLAFQWLMARIDLLTADIDRAASEFIERMNASPAPAQLPAVEPVKAARDGQAEPISAIAGSRVVASA